MSYEIIAVLVIAVYVQMIIIAFLINRAEARIMRLLHHSKTARGRSQLLIKKVELEKNIFRKSLLWPAMFVAQNDKQIKK